MAIEDYLPTRGYSSISTDAFVSDGVSAIRVGRIDAMWADCEGQTLVLVGDSQVRLKLPFQEILAAITGKKE